MMQPGDVTDVIIDRRFRGPANSGNGGYVCGLLAQAFDQPCEVTLKSPPPLDVSLQLYRYEDRAELRQGAQVIATAQAAEVDLSAPKAPSLELAEDAVSRFVDADKHILPECFVCGPHRADGDGLRIFTGPVDGQELVAAPWAPAAEFANSDGCVRDIFLWSALDCPSYFSLRQPEMMALLGRMKAHIIAPPIPGEELVAAAWCTGKDGRKYFADSALFNKDGELLAKAQTIWIALKKDGAGPSV